MRIGYLQTGVIDFDPQEFPHARDFTVEFTHFDTGLNLAYLVSEPETRIDWGWWHEPVERIRAWTLADIPCGTVDKPYEDTDQGWHILIWQVDDQIFVAEGDASRDEDDNHLYDRWFQVSGELYRAGWTAALDRLRAG